MASAGAVASEAAIWERVIQPKEPNLSPAAARSILELDFLPEDKERMHALAAKAQAGTLSTDDQDAIDSYGRVGSILSIMKSKARRALQQGRKARGARA